MIEQNKPRPGTAEAEIEGKIVSVEWSIQFDSTCIGVITVESSVKYTFLVKKPTTSWKLKRTSGGVAGRGWQGP